MEIAAGLLIGFAIGATGVGGGTLTAPVLILLLGYAPRTAVATALIFAAAVKFWASGLYLSKKEVDLRVLGFLLCGGIPGALCGALALQQFRSTRANEWILLLVGAIVLVTALTSLAASWRRYDIRPTSKLRLLPLIMFPIGLESGFSSSGTGALGTLALFHFTSLAPAAVVGTDIVFGMSVSAIGGGVHAWAGSCDWSALARLIPAGIIGSLLGVRFCRKLPHVVLRRAVLVSVTFVGCLLLYRGMRGILG